MIGEGINWWLRKEAANSSFNGNKPLDDLIDGRRAFMRRSDPKVNGHIGRMERWLELYRNPRLTPREMPDLVADMAFGGLMFLSGTFRRLGYLQANNQRDYYRRKIDRDYPGSVDIVGYADACIYRLRGRPLTGAAIVALGEQAIHTTELSFETIYSRVPADFGRDCSPSTQGIVGEQRQWLSFTCHLLAREAARTGRTVCDTPILGPKTIAEAEPVTFSQLLQSQAS